MAVTKDKFIKISKDFCEYPGVRLAKVSDHSAEEFYSTLLKPMFAEVLGSVGKLIVDLDGTAGLAASFLDGAFGSLTLEFGINKVLARLRIVTIEEPFLYGDIVEYIYDSVKPY